jgi:enolase
MKIASIKALQIFDSSGFPTVEAVVTLAGGTREYGMVPSGASTGQFEALELRDGDPGLFRGKSVFKAIDHIENEIAQALCGRDEFDQEALDRMLIELYDTPNKSRLGANAILAVSMAVASAAPTAQNEPLYSYLTAGKGSLIPVPEIQIVGGGTHANWRMDVQDCLLMATAAKTFEDVMEVTHNVYHAAGDILRSRGKYFGIADEGGFWPEFERNIEAQELLVDAICRADYIPRRDAGIALDISASDLYDKKSGRYRFNLENREFTSSQFCKLITDWCHHFPVVSIEDPMADTDWEGWWEITSKLGKSIQIVGDDIFTTNAQRIGKGIEAGIVNAVLIKLNQVGTVTETVEAIRLTQAAGWQPIVSARSGETEDAFISHLAVATNAGELKVGSFSRSERMAKWNEILRIQRDLGPRAQFKGFQEIR